LLELRTNSDVLCVASGPATEFQDVVEKWKQPELDRVRATLIDLDKEALEHAQTRIYNIAAKLGKNPNVNFVNASIKSFLTSQNEHNETYDLIYSGGLFDYLDNLTSAMLVRKFYSMLNSGGTLLIGNFTKDNKTKAFLHLLTNWTLIHKTEAEMKHWANDLGKCSVSVDFDKNKMHAFLVIKKDVN
jgi:chemotaxis methyl-accepting protein methylase